MDLFLQRTHYKTGTNGVLFHEGQFICFTIELPWRLNRQNISCIPDGCYELTPFYSPKYKHHLLVKDVDDRSGILIHPANDALGELRGCIAPITRLTGIGKGLASREALNQLLMRIEAFKEDQASIFLTVASVLSTR